MERVLRRPTRWTVALFIVLDVFTIGVGMGVPVFTILFGFPVGWFAARRRLGEADLATALAGCFRVAMLAALVSFVVLAVIWGPTLPMAWDASVDIAEFGHPMLLFEPLASFYAWLVLMIVVSPALQALTTLAASYGTLMRCYPSSHDETRSDG